MSIFFVGYIFSTQRREREGEDPFAGGGCGVDVEFKGLDSAMCPSMPCLRHGRISLLCYILLIFFWKLFIYLTILRPRCQVGN
jgi:hypothetical protein